MNTKITENTIIIYPVASGTILMVSVEKESMPIETLRSARKFKDASGRNLIDAAVAALFKVCQADNEKTGSSS